MSETAIASPETAVHDEIPVESGKVGTNMTRKAYRFRSHLHSMTTGEVAALFHVAPRTVSKWMDGGLLNHWRIPGSKDRRCSTADLKTFADKHNMPCHLPVTGGHIAVGLYPYEVYLIEASTGRKLATMSAIEAIAECVRCEAAGEITTVFIGMNNTPDSIKLIEQFVNHGASVTALQPSRIARPTIKNVTWISRPNFPVEDQR